VWGSEIYTIKFWEAFRTVEAVAELTDLAILLLGIVANQAGTERMFSDLKIKKSRLRNRLGTEKLHKMSKVCEYTCKHAALSPQPKVGSMIRSEQDADCHTQSHSRQARRNHSDDRVAELLAVPCYADILENEADPDDDNDGGSKSPIITSGKSWRQVIEGWRKTEQDPDLDPDSDAPETGRGAPSRSWLPRSLELLFGGKATRSAGVNTGASRCPFDRETLMMELLAAEYKDEPLDDGELEGSGDDYDG
jgi:hypothetical protein